jgi:cobalamin biosynthetic protein CobC
MVLNHGGRLEAARRRFPDAPEPFIDLSTGINRVPYPVGDLASDTFLRLPEPEAILGLEHDAAEAYGGTGATVVAAPGTQILISLLPYVLPHRRVSVLGPTYAEHAVAWAAAGSAVTEVGAFEQLGCARCAVLCNPNNPDGRRVSPEALLALADRLAGRDGLLVVDEAFADFEDEQSVAPWLPHPALLVLRSFGKAYGLAGVRLGFALTGEAIATRLRAALGPWAVSGPAVAIGRRALADRAWAAGATARLTRDAARLDALLTAAALGVVGGTRLFRLAESPRARTLFQQLGAKGILVREFPEGAGWLRFGIPGASAEWNRLADALGIPGCSE